MIKLVDLINLCGVTLQNFKIHCATEFWGNSDNPPLDAFFRGDFKTWQEGQSRRNFECQKILSLIRLPEPDKWLFAGVFEVHGCRKRGRGKNLWYKYSTKEVNGLGALTGHAIVQFPKTFRACYLRGETHINELLVIELRAERMSVGDFPGYKEALLTHEKLCTIVRQEVPTWRSALANVSGIYLITDNRTGKHYVGKASGGEGIWQRWSDYAKNGHGGNKELKVLLKSKRGNYENNFQYSILEVLDLDVDNEIVCDRETHWKNVLRSREFGYNVN